MRRIFFGSLLIATQGEVLLKAMQAGTVSTNVFLRRLHNFCVDITTSTSHQ